MPPFPVDEVGSPAEARDRGEGDGHEALDDLRSRGVEIQEYDMLGLKTVDGITDIGFARIAWLMMKS